MSAEDLRKEGNNAFRAGHFEKAAHLYSRALEAAPTDVHLLLNRAATYTSLHQYQRAINDAVAATHADPSSAKAWGRVVLCLTRMGCANEAARVLTHTPEAVDDSGAKLLNDARSELETLQGALSRLRVPLVEWVALPPADRVSEGDAIADAHALIHALKASPHSELLAFALMHALGRAQRFDAARNVASAMLRHRKAGVEGALASSLTIGEIAVDPPVALPSLAATDAALAAATGEFATEALAAVVRGDPDGSTPEGRGVPGLLRTLKHVAEAKERGNTAYKAGKYDDAIAAYQEALALSREKLPFVPGVFYTNVAAAYAASSQAEKAVEASKAALHEWRFNAKAWVRLATGLGAVKSGGLESSLAALKVAAMLSPDDSAVASKLAQARMKAGEDEEEFLLHPGTDAEARMLLDAPPAKAGAASSKSTQTLQRVKVIDVYATWCGPCKMLAPHFARIAAGRPGATFIKIDSDKCPGASTTLGVRALPTIIVTLDGKEVDRMEGADVKRLEDMVKTALETASRSGGSAPSTSASAGPASWLVQVERSADMVPATQDAVAAAGPLVGLA